VVSGPTYVTVLPCSPNVVAMGGVSYYGCGGSWYNQAYVNGSVTYVTVSAPPGYYNLWFIGLPARMSSA
jgi:hypothetical protein